MRQQVLWFVVARWCPDLPVLYFYYSMYEFLTSFFNSIIFSPPGSLDAEVIERKHYFFPAERAERNNLYLDSIEMIKNYKNTGRPNILYPTLQSRLL
jgi:hypothetical protein